MNIDPASRHLMWCPNQSVPLNTCDKSLYFKLENRSAVIDKAGQSLTNKIKIHLCKIFDGLGHTVSTIELISKTDLPNGVGEAKDEFDAYQKLVRKIKNPRELYYLANMKLQYTAGQTDDKKEITAFLAELFDGDLGMVHHNLRPEQKNQTVVSLLNSLHIILKHGFALCNITEKIVLCKQENQQIRAVLAGYKKLEDLDALLANPTHKDLSHFYNEKLSRWTPKYFIFDDYIQLVDYVRNQQEILKNEDPASNVQYSLKNDLALRLHEIQMFCVGAICYQLYMQELPYPKNICENVANYRKNFRYLKEYETLDVSSLNSDIPIKTPTKIQNELQRRGCSEELSEVISKLIEIKRLNRPTVSQLGSILEKFKPKPAKVLLSRIEPPPRHLRCHPHQSKHDETPILEPQNSLYFTLENRSAVIDKEGQFIAQGSCGRVHSHECKIFDGTGGTIKMVELISKIDLSEHEGEAKKESDLYHRLVQKIKDPGELYYLAQIMLQFTTGQTRNGKDVTAFLAERFDTTLTISDKEFDLIQKQQTVISLLNSLYVILKHRFALCDITKYNMLYKTENQQSRAVLSDLAGLEDIEALIANPTLENLSQFYRKFLRWNPEGFLFSEYKDLVEKLILVLNNINNNAPISKAKHDLEFNFAIGLNSLQIFCVGSFFYYLYTHEFPYPTNTCEKLPSYNDNFSHFIGYKTMDIGNILFKTPFEIQLKLQKHGCPQKLSEVISQLIKIDPLSRPNVSDLGLILEALNQT